MALAYLLSYKPVIASAPAPVMPIILTPQQQLAQFAKEYNANYEEMAKTIQGESGWQETVIGDHGLAYGIAQFHKDTFLRWSKEMGLTLDYHSTTDQLQVMAYAFGKGVKYKSAWTAWRNLQKNS